MNHDVMGAFEGGAADGRLVLPACPLCGEVQFPLRDFCGRCLCPDVVPAPVGGAGTIVASTTVLRTTDERFARSLPLHVASVRLDAGPLVWAFLPDSACVKGSRVDVRMRSEPGVIGRFVLEARRGAHG